MNAVRIQEIGNIARRTARRRRENDHILIVWKEIGKRSIGRDRSRKKNIGSTRTSKIRKEIEIEIDTEMATETETDNVMPIASKRRITVHR